LLTLRCYRIGLCITENLAVFSGLTFITAVTTVTPQIMLPLVGDLAPLHRRAAALSVVVAGLTLGILVARVLSGVIANYTSWRTTYWLSCGLQYLIFGLLWLFMPDYPSTNPDSFNYVKFMWSIVKFVLTEPLLMQACIISFLVSATFTNFWTTLTFLLAGEPYNYDPLPIGLFGLIGIVGIAFSPVYGRLVIDRYHPWLSVMVGLCMVVTAVTIGTYTGTFTVAGPVIQAIFHDAGMQTCQVANRSQIYSIAPRARNRINTAFMLFTFFGQLAGTAVGNRVYADGGWIHSGSVSVGFSGGAILILCLRGPWEKGWLGWHGGASLKKENLDAAKQDVEASGRVRRSTAPVVDPEEKNPTDIEKGLNEMAAEERGHGMRDVEKEVR
jgi:predicted MFS family arabinose efflux permease